MSEQQATQQLVVIGAGPIGCYLGQLLKKEGLNPLLIEEDHAYVASGNVDEPIGEVDRPRLQVRSRRDGVKPVGRRCLALEVSRLDLKGGEVICGTDPPRVLWPRALVQYGASDVSESGAPREEPKQAEQAEQRQELRPTQEDAQ